FGDKRTGKGKCGSLVFSANELRSCGNVSPLIRSPHLQLAVHFPVKVKKIITLNQLVCKLSKRHAFGCFAGKTLFYRILGHHIIYRKVLTYVTDKIKETKFLHPIVIVYQLGGIGLI